MTGSKPSSRKEEGAPTPGWGQRGASDPRYSQSLERGLAILRCFGTDRPVLGIADVADELGMSRSTTHRYMITLVALGYLEQGASRKYHLGLRVTDLGLAAVGGLNIRTAARPFLEDLRTQTTHSTSLAVLDGEDVCWLDTAKGTAQWVSPGFALQQAGSRMPAYLTAEGKLLMAFQPDRARAALVSRLKLTKRGPNTITSRRALRADLVSIRRRGFAVADQEQAPGVLALAAPVRGISGETIATIGLTAGSSTPGVEELVDAVASDLIDCTERLSTLLGAVPPPTPITRHRRPVDRATRHSSHTSDDARFNARVEAPKPMRGDAAGASPRTRLLQATVEVLAQRGFEGTTISVVTASARVSPRTFHELFDGLSDCIGAILQQALRHVLGIVTIAFAGERSWQDGMRTALLAILDFLDAEPALARVTMVESLAAGPGVLVHRERVAGAFRAAVVERIEDEVPHAWPLAAEAMFASVMGVVHAHLVARKRDPLVGLLPGLMATLIAPFSDAPEIAQEVSRSQQTTRDLLDQRARGGTPNPHASWAGVPIPPLLADPRACRARDGLRFVAEHRDCSNREVAAGIGIRHTSQTSSLLARLSLAGLLARHPAGPGKQNSWRLTEHGRRVLRELDGPALTLRATLQDVSVNS